MQSSYTYSLAEISHNPFELAALLTVLYENYSPSEAGGILKTIFDSQYRLTREVLVEIRKKKETRWRYVTHYREEVQVGVHIVDGKPETFTYTVSVPYQVRELRIQKSKTGDEGLSDSKEQCRFIL